MVTVAAPQRLKLPSPAVGAVAGGGLVAALFLFVPSDLLERGVIASGIPAVLAAAEPPLGFTARIALGLVFGGLAAGLIWLALTALGEGREMDLHKWVGRLKRARNDAAPRPPLFANRDLGTPFLDVKAPVASPAPPAEQALPLDLDQPLAAFDPAAMRDVPMPAPEPVKPLPRPQLIDPGDRFETFELTPMQRAPASTDRPISLRVPPVTTLRAQSLREPAPREAARVVAPETETTVHALLARLERGIGARDRQASAQPPRAHTLQDTLGDLRRLATGAQ